MEASDGWWAEMRSGLRVWARFNLSGGEGPGALALAFALAVIVAGVGWLTRAIQPVLAPARVASGVRLQGQPLGGLDERRLRERVGALASWLPASPQDARVDPELGLIPELDGVEVDVEATVTATLTARQGADVPLVYRRRPAAVTLYDLALQPIRQGNPAKRQVALAINVAWGNEYLPDLLSILKKHQAVGTFFLVGRWAEKYPDLARQIADAGHEIASHGYTTVDYQGLSREELKRQVVDAGEVILKVTGQRPTLFSPHKGEWTPELLQLLQEEEYLPIHWTVDTVDWKNPPPAEMTARVLSRAGPGSIILLHPTQSAVAGLDALLSGLKSKGLKVVSVSTLLDPDPLKGGGASAWEEDSTVQPVWLSR